MAGSESYRLLVDTALPATGTAPERLPELLSSLALLEDEMSMIPGLASPIFCPTDVRSVTGLAATRGEAAPEGEPAAGLLVPGGAGSRRTTGEAVTGDSAAVVRRVARQVWDRLQELGGSGSWQIRGIYELDLAERGAVVLGVTGLAAEARAFSIVGAGADEQAKSLRCPGLSHAPAFPIEVVIMSDAGRVRVTLVNQMYRMKMYFEDAGKMKFAANMRMPGSIEDEIRRLVTPGATVP